MVRIEIEIAQAEYDIFSKIARKLGVSVQTLIQAETDVTAQTVSCWLQRAEMILEIKA